MTIRRTAVCVAILVGVLPRTSVRGALNCPHAGCAKKLPFRATLCPYCRGDLRFSKPCPNCERPVRFGDAYCENCGAKLSWRGGEQSPGASAASAGTGRPATRPAPPAAAAPAPGDERIRQGIERAVAYLWAARRPDGSWNPEAVWAQVLAGPGEGGTRRVEKLDKDKMTRVPFPVGTTALACYALLESGVSPKDERMVPSLMWLARQQTRRTYSLALRANVWSAAARTEPKYLLHLRRDVATLVRSAPAGVYSYMSAGRPPKVPGRFPMLGGMMRGDNSNSQYGLLGVWAGAQATGVPVPAQYWQATGKYWTGAQNTDGGWGYVAGHSESYPSMTVAGLASLYVCNDNLQPGRFVHCGVNAKNPAIERGLDRLETTIAGAGLDSFRGPSGRAARKKLDMYYLFGVERVGLASGYKYFGQVKWFPEGAARILSAQQKDGHVPSGGWGSPTVGTAYAVLFLVRGRHPVLFNKLQFDSDWNNRPRDLASLSRWLSTTFERTVNWQIIRFRDPVAEWHDAPVLYISGSRDPNFTEAQLDQLRTFVQQGGTIFSVTECDGKGFYHGMRKACAKLFPGRSLRALRADHELFQAHFKVHATKFHMISNGIRPLVIHCDHDLPLAWQQRQGATQAWTHQIAANVALYVTGTRAFRPRGVSHWPEAPGPFVATRTARIVRLRYPGNWNPEPLALERLRRLLGRRDRIRLHVLEPVNVADVGKTDAHLAVLTGTGALTLGAAERKALQEFVAAGGTLLVDAAGGDQEFDKSAREQLEATFGARPKLLATISGVYRVAGKRITKVRYRGPAARRLVGETSGRVLGIQFGERTGVFHSPEDLTGALVGYESGACGGYAPESAYEIARNILLLASR